MTPEQQADLLLGRGMLGDRNAMIGRLSFVNYYRLSAYWWPYRVPCYGPTLDEGLPPPRCDEFLPGTEFELVWEHYVFDQQLRILVMEAIERIEVAIRTQLALHHSHRHGSDAYVIDRCSLPLLNDPHPQFVQTLCADAKKAAKQQFVLHFFKKYDESTWLPIWMAVELMTFGTLVILYWGSDNDVRDLVAAGFQVPNTTLGSWLKTLNDVRNISAHHGRLWNRPIVKPPQLPPKSRPEWHPTPAINVNRCYSVLSICNYMLGIVTHGQTTWARRLRDLFRKHPRVDIAHMGFPANWLDSPLWANAK